MGQAAKKEILEIPLTVFESAETKEELEDWLLANNPLFIEEMRRLKKKAESGEGRPLTEVAKKWDINL